MTDSGLELKSAPSYAGRWERIQPGLTDWVVSFLHDLGFQQMTPVQASTIPLFLNHKDVIVEAVTGSGKTLAFVIPIIEMLIRRSKSLKKDEVGAIVISPTRELAEQIYSVIQQFLQAFSSDKDGFGEEAARESEAPSSDDSDSEEDGKHTSKPLKRVANRKGQIISGVQLVVGGSTTKPAADYAHFKDNGPDILVGTPGRLEELLSKKGVKKGELEVLVLDEADRLLDLGFTENLRSILSLLPKQRRTGLFSATMTDALSELVRMGLRNPVRVVVKVETKQKAKEVNSAASGADDSRRTPASLQNMFQCSRPENKLAQLTRILLYESSPKGMSGGARKFIVYFSTCAQVSYFYSVLSQLPLFKHNGIQLYALHGKQTPGKRKSMFKAFVESTAHSGMSFASSSTNKLSSNGATVLLCTDVAARGLDLPDVEVVVQYDPPTDPKVFSHRCGRTARAGRKGRAIVMLHSGREEDFISYLGVKKIPLSAYPYLSTELEGAMEPESEDPGARSLEDQIRTMAKSDREIFELGVRGFVSYVRAYSKHEMKYIFRINDLDLAGVAHAFGLIRLPAMPEIKARKESFSYREEEIDFDTIAFKDPAKEKARLTQLEKKHILREEREAAAATAAQNDVDSLSSDSSDSGDDSDDDGSASKSQKKKKKKLGVPGIAWSVQKERKEIRNMRREKKSRKKAFLKSQRQVAAAEQEDDLNGKENNGQKQEEEEEEEDWDAEYRKLKKRKREQTKQKQNNAGGFSLTEGPDSDLDSNDEQRTESQAQQEEPFFVM